MPNWVDSRLHVTKGDPKEILDFIRSEESVVDFNSIVPMPDDVAARASQQEEAAPVLTLGDGTTVKAIKYPATWIAEEWNKETWGTKWNARYAAYSAKDPKHAVEFATAWYAPVPVFKALAKRFPDHKIVIHSDDDNMCYHAIFRLENGQMEERARTQRKRKPRKAEVAQ
jgi:Ferredoxin-like domain in Api92-like protein